MPAHNRLLPIVCGVAAIVLCMALVVAVRVNQESQYSTRVVPADPVSKDVLQKWDELEHSFALRQQPGDDVSLSHDPLWPTYMARAAAERAVTAATSGQVADLVPVKRRAAPSADRAGATPDKAEAPAFVPPRLLGLLLDRRARAVLQQDGKSHIVQSGDRIGALQIVDVSAAGVVIEWRGIRKLLQMR